MSVFKLISSSLLFSAAAIGAPTDKLQVRQDLPVEIPELRIPSGSLPAVHGLPGVIPEHISYTHHEIQQSSNATIVHPSPNMASKRAIIGTDDRVLWEYTGYPFEAVGRVILSNGVLCSGSLVGPRLISTAKHCVAEAGSGITYRYDPSFDIVERFETAAVTTILTVAEAADISGQCHTRDDWAIMVLDKPIGNDHGYFGAQVITSELQGTTGGYALGYPADKSSSTGAGTQPYFQSVITIRPMGTTVNADCDAYGPVVTDTDVIGGQSGSPLWVKDATDSRYQLGVLVSGTATDTFAAGGPSWVNAIINMRAAYP